MVQVLKPTDQLLDKNFWVIFQEKLNVNGFENRLVFIDEATFQGMKPHSFFHLCVKFNRHNLQFWGTEKAHVTLEHQRDSPKVNIFYPLSNSYVFGPFFFAENLIMETFTKTCSFSGCSHSWWKLFLISFCSKIMLPHIGISIYMSSWTNFYPPSLDWPCWATGFDMSSLASEITKSNALWFFFSGVSLKTRRLWLHFLRT